MIKCAIEKSFRIRIHHENKRVYSSSICYDTLWCSSRQRGLVMEKRRIKQGIIVILKAINRVKFNSKGDVISSGWNVQQPLKHFSGIPKAVLCIERKPIVLLWTKNRPWTYRSNHSWRLHDWACRRWSGKVSRWSYMKTSLGCRHNNPAHKFDINIFQLKF